MSKHILSENLEKEQKVSDFIRYSADKDTLQYQDHKLTTSSYRDGQKLQDPTNLKTKS